jgi:hypothetical protein
MNCKPIKDASCEECNDKRLCRTYLELKQLDEYDDTEPIGYKKVVCWDIDLPIIATLKRNPILGIEIETNVLWSSIPLFKQEIIKHWAETIGVKKLREDVDTVGVVRTF